MLQGRYYYNQDRYNVKAESYAGMQVQQLNVMASAPCPESCLVEELRKRASHGAQTVRNAGIRCGWIFTLHVSETHATGWRATYATTILCHNSDPTDWLASGLRHSREKDAVNSVQTRNKK